MKKKHNDELRKIAVVAKRENEESQRRIKQLEVELIENEGLIRTYESTSLTNEQKARGTLMTLEKTERELEETRISLEDQRRQNHQYSGNWIPKDTHQRETATLMAQIDSNNKAGRIAARSEMKEREALRRLQQSESILAQFQMTLNDEQVSYSQAMEKAERMKKRNSMYAKN